MIVEARDLTKTFPGNPPQQVLRRITLLADRGETIAIMGRSGEGKSTFLHLLGSLDTPTSGSLEVCGRPVSKSIGSALRNAHIGFIFQFYHLLDDFSVWENILMPARIGRRNLKEVEQRAHTLIDEVGLSHKVSEQARVLSGGEKQRVAIARALLNSPALILADEPTGNLDHAYSVEVQDLLLSASEKHGATLIVATHDQEFASRCSRLLHLKGGQLYTVKR